MQGFPLFSASHDFLLKIICVSNLSFKTVFITLCLCDCQTMYRTTAALNVQSPFVAAEGATTIRVQSSQLKDCKGMSLPSNRKHVYEPLH